MYRKKGFTLIELLAVILILGIIVLIAIPIVSKILSDAKKGAFEVTLDNIEKTVKDNCNMQILKEKTVTNLYTISKGIITPEVNIKGKLPDGKVNVDNKCNVTYELSNNNYTGIKNDPNSKPILTKGYNINNDPLPNIPNLDDGMIPVTISNDGSVKKADINSGWYQYDDNDLEHNNSKWANAVLVTNASRDSYKNAKVNSPINQSDIKAYLVWIPRFSYAIPTVTDKNNPPLINIKFETKDASKSNGSGIGTDYYTPQAFTFDGKELDGIWVSKFETSGTASAPTSIPNALTLCKQTVNAQYSTAHNFRNYGIVSSDVHMMKNTEWAVAAYLSHSKYGTNSQIRMNNTYAYTTGCGANSDDAEYTSNCEIQYGNATSYPQSTTGNITGIFDMAGGASEYVMGNYNYTVDDSGLSSWPEPKYIDIYKTEIFETACNNGPCKGHANYETKNWYNDNYLVANSSAAWVTRGGTSKGTKTSGIFQTAYNSGYSGTSISFRLTIIK